MKRSLRVEVHPEGFAVLLVPLHSRAFGGVVPRCANGDIPPVRRPGPSKMHTFSNPFYNLRLAG